MPREIFDTATLKNILGLCVLIPTLLWSRSQNAQVRVLLLFVMCASVWIIAFLFLRSKEGLVIVKSFLTVFWFVVAVYFSYMLFMQILSMTTG